MKVRVGSIAQWLAYLLPDPVAPGSIPIIPKKIYVAEVNQQRCLKERGQWLKNALEPI